MFPIFFLSSRLARLLVARRNKFKRSSPRLAHPISAEFFTEERVVRGNEPINFARLRQFFRLRALSYISKYEIRRARYQVKSDVSCVRCICNMYAPYRARGRIVRREEKNFLKSTVSRSKKCAVRLIQVTFQKMRAFLSLSLLICLSLSLSLSFPFSRASLLEYYYLQFEDTEILLRGEVSKFNTTFLLRSRK